MVWIHFFKNENIYYAWKAQMSLFLHDSEIPAQLFTYKYKAHWGV